MKNWNILLEPDNDGQTTATVVEMPVVRVTATTRQRALDAIQELLTQRLANAEMVQLEVPTVEPEQDPWEKIKQLPADENPWQKFGGIFENNSDFDKIVETIRSERLE